MGKQDLSATRVASLIRAAVPGRTRVSINLWLQVTPSGTSSWVIRFMRAGQCREGGLGSTRRVSLSEARAATLEASRLLWQGQDPIEVRRAAKAAMQAPSARSLTFGQCMQKYVATQRSGWRSDRHAKEWSSSVERLAAPLLEMPIATIKREDIRATLEPSWKAKHVTASRVLTRIASVFDWAIASGHRTDGNPAESGPLSILLGKVQVQKTHMAALPHAQVPAFMKALHAVPGTAARCMEFLILTAVRSSTARNATWSQINFDEQTWSIPGASMKNGKDHVVALTEPAITLLRALPRNPKSDLIFPPARGAALPDCAVIDLTSRICEALKLPRATPHGFRASFKGWAEDTTSHDRIAIELALAHTTGDATENSYRRTSPMSIKRAALLADWASFCYSTPAVVTPIGKRSKASA